MEIQNRTTSGETSRLTIIVTAVVPVAMTLILWAQGRIWWCKTGDAAIYIREAWGSSHTSQHLLDPYTFTHLLHGVAFFWITHLLFSRLTVGWRFFIATIAEAAWEILENSSFIIEKYRENTASLDYFGDSIFNSIGDLGASAAGFWIAYKIGRWPSLLLFVITELSLLFFIRDSLLVNIIMLIYPIDALKQWQMGL
jgi:hypothetical protein